jgi:cell division transport system permease protein
VSASEAAQQPRAFAAERGVQLIPHDSVSGRALTVVIAILTFLACLAAGGAVILADASSRWRADISREIAVQIKPRLGLNLDAEVEKVVAVASKSAAVAAVRRPSAQETAEALAPWLGSGLDLSELPVPRLVVVTLASDDAAAIGALRGEIARSAPEAIFDDHSLWLKHLSAVGRSLTAFATLLVALVVAAIVAAVGFATRGAMAGAREIVEVLHYCGASDRYITGHIQRYFVRLSLEGTAFGGGGAMGLFLVSRLFSSGGGEERATLSVLLGAFHLPLFGYVAIVGVCALLVAVTGLFSRFIAAAHLRGVN